MFIIAGYISAIYVSYTPSFTIHLHIYATLLFKLFQNDPTIPCCHFPVQNVFHLKHFIRGKLKEKKSDVLEKMQFLLMLDHLYYHFQKQWLVTAKFWGYTFLRMSASHETFNWDFKYIFSLSKILLLMFIPKKTPLNSWLSNLLLISISHSKRFLTGV